MSEGLGSQSWREDFDLKVIKIQKRKKKKNRETIDLSKFIHKAPKKDNQVANSGTLGHSCILVQSERTKKRN